LKVGQGSAGQKSLIAALAAASYVIESAGGAILAMTDGVAGRSQRQRAKPLKHDEKLSLYSGARRDGRRNRTLKISTAKSATIQKAITAACEAPTASFDAQNGSRESFINEFQQTAG
jgi:hypothetical protein